MPRYLGALIEIGLLVYCLIDCLQADTNRVRNLPRVGWLLLIVFVPIVGGVAWLVAGRPLVGSPARTVPWPTTTTAGFPEYERPRGPDDDPTFLADMRTSDAQHERMLSEWEAQLREREARLAEPDAGTDPLPRSES